MGHEEGWWLARCDPDTTISPVDHARKKNPFIVQSKPCTCGARKTREPCTCPHLNDRSECTNADPNQPEKDPQPSSDG
jgi:hypothetical protein